MSKHFNLSKDLTFQEALDALQEGKFVRLPEWIGYWFKDAADGKVKVFTREGNVLETPEYTKHMHRMDWQIAEFGLGFEFAVLALKAGKRLTRLDWVLGEFIFVRPGDELPHEFIPKVKSLNEETKNFLYLETRDIKFLPYLCRYTENGDVLNGWNPSPEDFFATDWLVAATPAPISHALSA